MKIGILSSTPKAFSTRRLKEAAKGRGHQVKILPAHHLMLTIDESLHELDFRQKELAKFDAIIPRMSAATSTFSLAAVRQIEELGIFCLNSSQAINIARDKLRTLQLLARHDIGIPKSVFILNKTDIPAAIARVGGAPVIIKLVHGTQGVGVMLADTQKGAEAIIETLHLAQQNVIVQKFVRESRGRDIRAFVVGDRVVAAMRRVAQGQDFRSNVHRGGLAEKVKLGPDFERTAIKAAKVLGLRVAGVDMLESNEGPKVMEVNASPGLEGIEGATRIDVASSIIEYLEENVELADADVRDRINLVRGYKLTRVPVWKRSPLLGATIGRLTERGITTLSLYRTNKVLPMPSPGEKLLLGDSLLCFGPEPELRLFVPRKRSRIPKT